jgi:hypothetical protein
MLPLPIQFLVATISAAINDRMARQLGYAQEEVRTLKDVLAVACRSPAHQTPKSAHSTGAMNCRYAPLIGPKLSFGT